jgi:parvulin-like peptidyl-prolyl isomerase
MTSPKLTRRIATLSLFLVLTLSACGITSGFNLIPATHSATPTPAPSPTPTATPIPLALSVDGEGITIPEFEAELARYQQAQTSLGNTVNLEAAKKNVSDEFIDLLLLAQGAAAKGYQVDDAMLQSRIDDLAVQVGGPEALTAWQTAHGYTDATFRSDLRRQMAAAAMRDQVAASVAATAEQVHVKQILLYNSAAAQEALGFLKAGWDFNDLAARYDPVAKGELGWFPRGYLSDPSIETAAFALQAGQYSDIIKTQAGYDILFVVARDTARPLSPDALLTLQERTLQDWLTQQRNESTILLAP